MKRAGHKFKTDQGRLLKHGTFLHRLLGKIKVCALKLSKLRALPSLSQTKKPNNPNESFEPCTPAKVKNSALNTPLNPGNHNPTTKALQSVLAFLGPPKAIHSPYPSSNCRCHDLLPPPPTHRKEITYKQS